MKGFSQLCNEGCDPLRVVFALNSCREVEHSFEQSVFLRQLRHQSTPRTHKCLNLRQC